MTVSQLATAVCIVIRTALGKCVKTASRRREIVCQAKEVLTVLESNRVVTLVKLKLRFVGPLKIQEKVPF
eukprot:66423-Hanusia_phi.AAC.2